MELSRIMYVIVSEWGTIHAVGVNNDGGISNG